VLRRYGSTSDSRLANPDVAQKVFCWYLDEERDEVGNIVRCVWEDSSNDAASTAMADGNRGSTAYRYLKRILYGNVVPDSTEDGWYLEIVFDYGEHPSDTRDTESTAPRRQDVFSRFKPGFDLRCTRLCRRVLVFHRFDDGADADAVLTKITTFTYDESPNATTLSSVTHTGVDPDGDPLSLPSATFTYTQGECRFDASLRHRSRCRARGRLLGGAVRRSRWRGNGRPSNGGRWCLVPHAERG